METNVHLISYFMTIHEQRIITVRGLLEKKLPTSGQLSKVKNKK